MMGFTQKTLALLLLAFPAAAPATAVQIVAPAAIVIDHNTGILLINRKADQPLPPASMSKLMTLNMLFEAIEDGTITLETEFRTSTKAYNMGGSKMFLRDGERVSVENLIRGIVVQSGNDACVVVAEGLSSSEEQFAKNMNNRAVKLGLTDSYFANASGWPDPDHKMSLRDIAKLSRHIIETYPQYYKYFAEQTFSWDNIKQENRNPLLKLELGVDGLKTGYTEEAGYGLAASAKQGDRRVTFVIAGLGSTQQRAVEGEKILNWVFKDFREKTVYTANSEIARADVWIGKQPTVGLALGEDVNLLVPKGLDKLPIADVVLHSPVEAPIRKGQEIGKLMIDIPGHYKMDYPVYATEDVGKGGLLVRMMTVARTLWEKI